MSAHLDRLLNDLRERLSPAVERAAIAMYHLRRPEGTDWWALATGADREFVRGEARVIVEATLAGCDVREEWGVEVVDEFGDETITWHASRFLAEQHYEVVADVYRTRPEHAYSTVELVVQRWLAISTESAMVRTS